jgi:Ni/Co efflux regulator RcnB
MRMLPIIAGLALVVGAAVTAPGTAKSAGAGPGEPLLRLSEVKSGAIFWGERRIKRRNDRRFERRRDRRRNRRLFLYPRYYDRDFYDRRSYREREEIVIDPQPAPVEAPPVVEAPAEPPDVHGPLHLTPARGVVPGAAPYVVGEPLPAGLPHVTLDWRLYELPRPPSGRLYARIGRDVLLITAAGRIVERVLPPG